MSALPSARVLRRALGVVADLPPAALAELIERLVDRLDTAEPDPDGEAENEGCCDAADDDPRSSRPDYGSSGWGAGDPLDAEPGEDAEPDDEA